MAPNEHDIQIELEGIIQLLARNLYDDSDVFCARCSRTRTTPSSSAASWPMSAVTPCSSRASTSRSTISRGRRTKMSRAGCTSPAAGAPRERVPQHARCHAGAHQRLRPVHHARYPQECGREGGVVGGRGVQAHRVGVGCL